MAARRVADRDARGPGHGVAFGEESRRQVRSRAALDFRRAVEPPCPRGHAVGRTDAIDNALREPADRLAQKPPLGRPHLFGRALDEEQSLALRLAQQAVPRGVSGDDFHRVLGRPGRNRHDGLGGEIEHGRPHPRQIGGRYFFDRQPVGRFVECVRGHGVDLPGVKDDRAVRSLDIEFQPLGRRIVGHHQLQSIAAFAPAGNANGLGLFRGGRGLDRDPLVEDFGGQGHRGDEAFDHAQTLHVLGIDLGQRITAGWPRRLPARNRTLSEAIHGTSFTPSEKLGQAAQFHLKVEPRLGSANQADAALDLFAVFWHDWTSSPAR